MNRMMLILVVGTLLWADDPCSEKAQQSVGGQVMHQLTLQLQLQPEQLSQIQAISRQWSDDVAHMFTVVDHDILAFFSALEAAMTDGELSAEERGQLLALRQTVKQHRRRIVNTVLTTGDEVKMVLTEPQRKVMADFEPDIDVPQETLDQVMQVAEQIDQVVHAFVTHGQVEPTVITGLVIDVQSLGESVYIPDWLEARAQFWREIAVRYAPLVQSARGQFDFLDQEQLAVLRLLGAMRTGLIHRVRPVLTELLGNPVKVHLLATGLAAPLSNCS